MNAGSGTDTDVRTNEKKYGGGRERRDGAVRREVRRHGARGESSRRSTELCGGTHVRNTGHILLFRIVSESGVAAGVRRIVAVTGPKAYELLRAEEQRLSRLSDM